MFTTSLFLHQQLFHDSERNYSYQHHFATTRLSCQIAANIVASNTKKPAVGIVAITDQEEVVLVEQFRPPVGRKAVELPAGPAGDTPDSENEALL